MITFPRGRRLSLGLTSFADANLTDVAVDSIRGAITFAEDLDAETSDAVLAWLDAKDDADQTRRADLRAKRDAITGDDAVSVAVRAAINYQLGD